jgi:two-component system response regulator YesN
MVRLLVVDDEWLIRKGIVQMVKRLNPEWSIEEANNGKEAIEIIKQSSFELIFCDIKMPGVDGIEMLEILNKQGFRIPLIFLTGYDEFKLMRNAIRLRAYDYLLKPVHDDDIIAVLSKFEEDFMNIKILTNQHQTRLQNFEFKLINAMNSYDTDHISVAIEEGQISLSDCMTKKDYVDEVIRIANLFFTKNRIHGFDKDVMISSNDLTNLANLEHAIQIRIAYLRDEINPSNDRSINMAKAYIDKHLQDSLSLTEVANHVHFNATYFSEYFKEKCGETFSQYVMRMKMEQAQKMLEDPANRIIDISNYLGYKNPRSFTKMFKIIMGMTPKEYRDNQM